LLKQESRFIDKEGELLKSSVIDATYKADEKLVELLLTEKDIKDKFFKLGVTPGNLDQTEFANFVEAELKKWESVAASAKIIKQ
jgi:tripartite-type tricarboxylate transporter receptor subunit TctC